MRFNIYHIRNRYIKWFQRLNYSAMRLVIIGQHKFNSLAILLLHFALYPFFLFEFCFHSFTLNLAVMVVDFKHREHTGTEKNN